MQRQVRTCEGRNNGKSNFVMFTLGFGVKHAPHSNPLINLESAITFFIEVNDFCSSIYICIHIISNREYSSKLLVKVKKNP